MFKRKGNEEDDDQDDSFKANINGEEINAMIGGYVI